MVDVVLTTRLRANQDNVTPNLGPMRKVHAVLLMGGVEILLLTVNVRDASTIDQKVREVTKHLSHSLETNMSHVVLITDYVGQGEAEFQHILS